MSDLLRWVVANQLDLEACLLILRTLVDINTVTHRTKRVVSLGGVELSLRIRVNSKLMVFGLPNNTIELVDFSLDENLLVGD